MVTWTPTLFLTQKKKHEKSNQHLIALIIHLPKHNIRWNKWHSHKLIKNLSILRLSEVYASWVPYSMYWTYRQKRRCNIRLQKLHSRAGQALNPLLSTFISFPILFLRWHVYIHEISRPIYLQVPRYHLLLYECDID